MSAPADLRGPQSVFADLSMSGMSASLALAARRGRAISDYVRCLAAVREPADIYALQLGYWTQMVDDYSKAFSEAVASASHAEAQAASAATVSFATPQPAQAA